VSRQPPSLRALCATFWLVGCGGDAGDSADKAPTEDAAACGEPVQEAVAGLQVGCESGACSVILDELSPEPPDRGDNTWTLRVVDGAGAQVVVESVTLSPFMPAHNHGTAPADFPATATGSGAWTAGPFDLFMPGRWEVRVAVGVGEDNVEHAVFAFCVEG